MDSVIPQQWRVLNSLWQMQASMRYQVTNRVINRVFSNKFLKMFKVLAKLLGIQAALNHFAKHISCHLWNFNLVNFQIFNKFIFKTWRKFLSYSNLIIAICKYKPHLNFWFRILIWSLIDLLNNKRLINFRREKNKTSWISTFKYARKFSNWCLVIFLNLSCQILNYQILQVSKLNQCNLKFQVFCKFYAFDVFNDLNVRNSKFFKLIFLRCKKIASKICLICYLIAAASVLH